MLMKVVECVHCGGADAVRNGKTRNGKQRLKCKDCGRASREERRGPRYSEEDKETILRAYQERPSMRGIQRIFGVSRQTLSVWLKKRQEIEQQQASPTGTGGDSAARPS
ncbi:IS1 family transposase [bacterium]|nr:MAG: IS1 family transposase [bacterium]